MKNWRNMTCTCIAVALALAALPALADVPTAVVKIHDQFGKELPNLIVSMHTDGGEFIKLEPGPDGTYLVSSPKGKVTLELEGPMLATTQVDLALPAPKGQFDIELIDGHARVVPLNSDVAQNRLDSKLDYQAGMQGKHVPTGQPGSLRGSAAQYLVGPGTGADDCSAADPISGDGTYMFDNMGATTDGPPDPACDFFSQDQINSDVWFCWTAGCDAMVEVTTCGGTSLDTKLAVYDGCTCPVGAPLDCNDDGCGGPLQSTVTFAATGGNTYLIRIGSFSTTTQGSGTFSVTSTPGCGGGGGGCPAGGDGDECDAPIVVSEGVFAGDTSDNTGSTGDDTSCAFSDTIDEWYCYTASCTGMATATTCGSSFDTSLAAFDGCGGAELACNDDDCGLQSTIMWPVTSGTSYFVRVSGFNGATGAYSLDISCAGGGGGSCPAGGDGDECDAPIVVSEGVFAGDTSDNTGSTGDDSSCGFSDTIDEWYCYTASCTGTATASTCGSGFDTTLAAYDGCGGAELACNDDDCGLQSTIMWPVTMGTSYFVRVSGFNGASGSYTLDISCAGGGGGGGGGDDCANAEAISGVGTFAFDNTNATTDGVGDPLCDSFGTDQIENDVWFCWTSDCDDNVQITTVGMTGVDTRIAVYDGCSCPTGNGILACNDDSAGTLQSTVTFDATSGNTYLIRIGVFPGALGGTGNFEITCVAPPMQICFEPAANCQNYSTVDALNATVGLFDTLDDFTPAADGNITSLCWWGAYLPALAADSFTVTYYADAGGFPGAIIGGPFSGGSLTVMGPEDTGDLVAGLAPIYEYTGSHAAVSVSAGQCYWLQISNLPGAGASWFWEEALTGNGRCLQGGAPVQGVDLSFCFDIALGDPTACLPPPAANDDCANADMIAGVGVFPFDNSAATTDGVGDPLCDSFGTDQIENDVWFCWTSDCDDNVQVSTVGLTGVDTRIAVYDGCSCPTGNGILACNDDAAGTLQSQVTFDATAGNTYLIRIGNFPGAGGGTGQFEITCIAPPMQICFEPSSNCQDYSTVDALNATVGLFDTLDDFTPAADGNITSLCWWGAYLPALAADSFTVTYYADAGGVPGAIIGGPFSGGSLTVMGPEDTGDLVAGIAPIYEYTGSHAAVSVSAGQCYWLQISNLPGAGASWFWEEALSGNGRCLQGGAPVLGVDLSFCFDIALGDSTACLPPPPPGDLCEDAIGPVAVPSVTPGSTEGATTDTGFPSPCGSGSITSPGVWYTVVGTGNTMTANTCNGATNYDSKINVYCNVDCMMPGAATCIDGNDDFCGLQSQVTWCSQPGALYYVLVHGFGGATGPFELVISDDGVPCQGAIMCIALGACCLPDGTCLDNVSQFDCESQDGVYQGDETSCAGGAAGYVINDCQDAFEDISATGTPLFLSDDDSSLQNLGFTFNFFGVDHTDVSVSSNGYLTFGPVGTDFSNDPIPSTGTPNDIICPLWDDFNPSSGGQVYAQTLGAAPNRRFIAQWDGVPQFANTDSNTFEAILFEGSNAISFRYGPITPEGSAGDYTIGVENPTGTEGASVPGDSVSDGSCLSVTAVVVPPIECPVACDDCPPGTNPLVDANGDNSGWCWSTNAPNGVDIFVDDVVPGSHALIEISKDFVGQQSQYGLMPAILIDFVQVCEDDATVNMIRIADESITNLTSNDWTDFHWILFDGPEAWFDVNASSGFSVFPPFTVKMFDDFLDMPTNNMAKRLSAFGGTVPRFSSFFPGDGAGDLKIGIDLSGENRVSFTLKEIPTTDRVGFLDVNGGVATSHVTVSPQDVFEMTDGMGEFVRFYETGTAVTLTAEANVDGRPFLRWNIDGVAQPAWLKTITVDVNAASNATAVYRGGTSGRIDTPVVGNQ